MNENLQHWNPILSLILWRNRHFDDLDSSSIKNLKTPILMTICKCIVWCQFLLQHKLISNSYSTWFISLLYLNLVACYKFWFELSTQKWIYIWRFSYPTTSCWLNINCSETTLQLHLGIWIVNSKMNLHLGIFISNYLRRADRALVVLKQYCIWIWGFPYNFRYVENPCIFWSLPTYHFYSYDIALLLIWYCTFTHMQIALSNSIFAPKNVSAILVFFSVLSKMYRFRPLFLILSRFNLTCCEIIYLRPNM